MEPQYGVVKDKKWGKEFWIVNCEKFCGKILSFEEGKKCSFHYHKIKEEVFFLLSGKMTIWLSDGDDLEKAQVLTLNEGDIVHIKVGLRHRMLAEEESQLLEISTQHFEDDSYRIVESG